MLDNLQQLAIDRFKEGLNIFITGNAGCGKSYLVKKMMELDSTKNIAVTSTTGISSLNINGRTFHSWCGITPDTDLEKIEEFVQEVNSNHKKWNKWLFTDILIIDEISMLDGRLLDFVNNVAKLIRGNNKSFGGIQLIATGDFYQLPPVNKDKTKTVFCFECDSWNELIDQIIMLKTNYRQDEKELIKFLGYIRKGQINDFVKEKLVFYSKNSNYDMRQYTHLFPHRNDVNRHNIAKLNELTGLLFKNKATTISLLNKKEVDYFPKDTTITQNLQLKIGALVIINKNINQDIGLVNGRQCIINTIQGTENNIESITVSLSTGEIHTINKSIWVFNDYEIEQFPLTLAWALTIHKAQGMGIEKLSVDIGLNIFNKGQVYVALSRCINSKYLHIKNFNISAIRAHKSVKSFYHKISKTSWFEFKNESGKIFYQNKDTEETSWKLPKNGIVLDYDTLSNDTLSNDTLSNEDTKYNLVKKVNSENLCKKCNKNEYFSNFWCDYKERVCLQCISSNSDGYFKQYNKTELKLECHFSDKKIDSVLPNCKFGYEKSLFGYRGTKIYILGQVRKNLLEQKDLLDYFPNSPNSIVNRVSKNIENTVRTHKKSIGKKTDKKPSHDVTMDLFKLGKSVDDIVKERNLKKGSVIAHLIKNMPHQLITYDKFMSKDEFVEIQKCMEVMGKDTSFSLIKRNINSKISYDKIRLVRSFTNY